MGFLNKQWLKGAPERNRTHRPEKVTITSELVKSHWDITNGVSGVVRIRRQTGDYQLLLFTNEELARVLPTLMWSADEKTRKEIAVSAITALDDSNLIALLEQVFKERARKKAE